MTDPASLKGTASRLPRIDIAVLTAENGIAGPVEEVTADFAGKQMERNCFGAVNTLNAVLPEMRRQHSGCVLFASSPLPSFRGICLP